MKFLFMKLFLASYTFITLLNILLPDTMVSSFLFSFMGLGVSSFGTSATIWPATPGTDDVRGAASENIGGVNRNVGENLPQHRFVHHKSNMT
jgi:hypothetical protein